MPPDPQVALRAPAASCIAMPFVLTGCPTRAASAASGPAPPPTASARPVRARADAPGTVASANDIDAGGVESR
jgi:hypothetical protein